jgi:hypothetical protein
MKKVMILLSLIIFTFLGLSLILHLTYGDSYPFLQGENSWQPDGDGGWTQHGQPAKDIPVEASVNIPILIKYIPIFIPALILIIFYLTPLSRKFETPPKESEPDEESIVEDENVGD